MLVNFISVGPYFYFVRKERRPVAVGKEYVGGCVRLSERKRSIHQFLREPALPVLRKFSYLFVGPTGYF